MRSNVLSKKETNKNKHWNGASFPTVSSLKYTIIISSRYLQV